MIRYKYNQQVHPPAPFVHVHLRNLDASRELLDLPAQIDTGADFTVIPQHTADELQLFAARQLDVLGFGGLVEKVSTYFLRAATRQSDHVLLEVVGSSSEPNVLLGRDFLNHFRIVLDGPQLGLELE